MLSIWKSVNLKVFDITVCDTVERITYIGPIGNWTQDFLLQSLGSILAVDQLNLSPIE